ncbi:hypothetical protein LPJ64_002952 [Coemansia asiatica]|uniref:Myb-like domain-containing protein n=1 Tax=Coemansia asiatica TaxID=1052880 RepID=A0A9W8CKF9_9FUNG|nr:hypothetical protein LPJ64_002952 [Coemansia asiatica]KAJ2861712.1 hypothetical protein FB639_005471 [Coemansia asiatica]
MLRKPALSQGRRWLSISANVCQKHGDMQRLQDLAKHLIEDAQDAKELSTKTEDTISEPTKAQTLPTFPLNLASQAEDDVEDDVEDDLESKANASDQSESKQQTADSISKSKWSLQDKKRLIRVADQCREFKDGRTSWADVAAQFPGRSAQSCADMHRAILCENNIHSIEKYKTAHRDIVVKERDKNRRVFTKDERMLLEKVVHKYGDQSWAAITEEMNALTGIVRQKPVYRNMWCFCMCSKALKAPRWDASKAEKLKRLAKEHGKDEVFLTYEFFPEYTPAIISYMLRNMDTDKACRDYRPNSFWEKRDAEE